MRAFEGQFSDNKPIQRNKDEKRRLLRELEETLASLKAHASPSLRESLKTRIQTLKTELAGR
ncbi:hypothetical protein [Roseomonas elaeocarpi]|uniref:DUF465 domain-containing protein n=1 Tax=Roseomonas elaeocarpi TaxID=907779 RepID=A0ABV6JXM4_9PROT